MGKASRIFMFVVALFLITATVAGARPSGRSKGAGLPFGTVMTSTISGSTVLYTPTTVVNYVTTTTAMGGTATFTSTAYRTTTTSVGDITFSIGESTVTENGTPGQSCDKGSANGWFCPTAG